MNLRAFLAVLAIAMVGLDLGSARPTRTDLNANPDRAVLEHDGQFTWDPRDAYEKFQKRTFWQKRCKKALTQAGCASGTIHKGEIKLVRNGKHTSYINVEGAPSAGAGRWKKLRVFRDGTTEDVTESGWSPRDKKLMRMAKLTNKKTTSEGQKDSLSWIPADTWKDKHMRRVFWERICRPALARAGCSGGTIHRGVSKSIKNGQKTSFVSVEGSPSEGMEYKKKLRIYRDGTSEDFTEIGWPKRDSLKVAAAKTMEGIEGAKRAGKNAEKMAEMEAEAQKVKLSWDPVDAYKNLQDRRGFWEQKCRQALISKGCSVGVIHNRESHSNRNGQKTSYVRVEGAPSTGMEKEKIRVFRDGTFEDGWSHRDERFVKEGKWVRKRIETRYQGRHSQEGHIKDAISWDPVDAYRDQPARKLYWELKCREALAKKGCGVGIIHKGERKVVRNGETTFYVKVEGAPSKDMEYRKMHLFQDGTSEDVAGNRWSDQDQRLMRQAKWKRKGMPPQEDQTALVSWNSTDAYKNQPRRKAFREEVCRPALAREGCSVGTIHKGESTGMRSGRVASYVRVEGAPSDGAGMEYEKKMRVFYDGSAEETREPASKRRKTHQKQPMGLVEGDTSSAQLPTEEAHPDRFQASGGRMLDLNFPPDWESSQS